MRISPMALRRLFSFTLLILRVIVPPLGNLALTPWGLSRSGTVLGSLSFSLNDSLSAIKKNSRIAVVAASCKRTKSGSSAGIEMTTLLIEGAFVGSEASRRALSSSNPLRVPMGILVYGAKSVEILRGSWFGI